MISSLADKIDQIPYGFWITAGWSIAQGWKENSVNKQLGELGNPFEESVLTPNWMKQSPDVIHLREGLEIRVHPNSKVQILATTPKSLPSPMVDGSS